ncbi:enoyl-CoA hydratase/isomerase family protein [Chloroflexota bacterium]
MDTQDIIYNKESGIATITLNRPDKMNALTAGISNGIYESIEDASKDDDIRVVIITGTGRAFCSGADVKAMAEKAGKRTVSEVSKKKDETRIPRVHIAQLLNECEKPVIAALNGVAVGVGLDMALACDIRIASDRTRLSEAYIRRGITPAGGGAYFLPKLIGIDKACQLIFTGDMIDAREAERIGMVTMVVPHEELESTARDLAEKIAKGPLQAIKYAKKAIYASLTTDLKTSLDYTMAIRQELLKTEDHREGAVSFVEKRAPVFKKNK